MRRMPSKQANWPKRMHCLRRRRPSKRAALTGWLRPIRFPAVVKSPSHGCVMPRRPHTSPMRRPCSPRTARMRTSELTTYKKRRTPMRRSETAKLEEAVAAYREALKEWTRERVPFRWARSQNDLGIALAALGRRENGTGKLEEAVGAHREALKEGTRERMPLEWARVQTNL